jgi:hypothetical protein
MKKGIGWPLVLIGGAVIVIGYIATFGVGLYFEYKGIKTIVDGDGVLTGMWIMGGVGLVAAMVVSLINLRGAVLLAAGQKLLGRDGF